MTYFSKNGVIDLLPQQLRVDIDDKLTSWRLHSAKVLRIKIGIYIIVTVTDILGHLTCNSREAWLTAFVMLQSVISEILD